MQTWRGMVRSVLTRSQATAAATFHSSAYMLLADVDNSLIARTIETSGNGVRFR
jgi:hypothetical protein